MSLSYYSLNQYLQEAFGCKVYKIALNGGFTCPNRDGTIDTRGCIFCSGDNRFNTRAFLLTESISLIFRRIQIHMDQSKN